MAPADCRRSTAATSAWPLGLCSQRRTRGAHSPRTPSPIAAVPSWAAPGAPLCAPVTWPQACTRCADKGCRRTLSWPNSPSMFRPGSRDRRSSEEFGQRRAGVGRAHEGLTHQEGVDAGVAHLAHVLGAQNPALGHQLSIGRHPGLQRQGGLQ